MAVDKAMEIAELEKEALGGDKNAQYQLGCCYRNGKGCKKDKTLAEMYFRKAAMQNHKDAQFELALLLRDRNNSEFWHWFCCAYINGDINAMHCLNIHLERAKDNATLMKEKLDQVCQYIRRNGVAPTEDKNFLNSIEPTEGCYIATAVYGSYDAPQVLVLRKYRDERLLRCKLGRLFVQIYYALSPTIAFKLKDKNKINLTIKKGLDAVVKRLEKSGYNLNSN